VLGHDGVATHVIDKDLYWKVAPSMRRSAGCSRKFLNLRRPLWRAVPRSRCNPSGTDDLRLGKTGLQTAVCWP